MTYTGKQDLNAPSALPIPMLCQVSSFWVVRYVKQSSWAHFSDKWDLSLM